MRCDITIIGGGLAGCTAAARICAEADASVILIEKREIGSSNPTPLTFTDVVEKNGLQHCVEQRYNKFVFHSPLGSKGVFVFEGSPLVALNYKKACQTIFERAAAMGRLKYINNEVSEVCQNERLQGDKVELVLQSGERLTSDLLIDASGRAHLAAKAIGIDISPYYSHCYGERFENHTTNTEMCCFLGPSKRFGSGGGWYYSIGNDKASFGYAKVTRSPDYPKKELKDNYYRALKEFSPYSKILSDSTPVRAEMGSIPIVPIKNFAQHRVMIVGDAAGQATIWSCMGSETALVNGNLSGKIAIKAYKKQDFSKNVLQEYQREWNKINKKNYQKAAMIAGAMWFQDERVWDEQILIMSKFSPQQMLERMRYNAHTGNIIWFFVALARNKIGAIKKAIF